jgi:hypothetical protein
MKNALIFMFVVTFTTLFTTGAFAGWKLYDDFDNYVGIAALKASGKWSISEQDEAIANFSIDNGRLKIEHIEGNPNDSAWAELIDKVKKIKGIRATIEVESWDGNVSARIGADVGVLSENPDNLVWLQMQLRRLPASFYRETVRGEVSILSVPTDYATLYSWFYTELGAGINPVADLPYTLETKWGKKKVFFGVDDPEDMGNVKYKFIETIDQIDEPFRGIGTRSSDKYGTCVVYIDDVYVLK